MDRPSKKWRPTIALFLAESYGRHLEDLEENRDILFAAGAGEIMHNASLMLDDIQDESELRRGEPCTYKKYGIDNALNTGAFLMFNLLVAAERFLTPAKCKIY